MILVAGATGFVGAHLVKRLAADERLTVRVLLRPGTDTTKLPKSVRLHAMLGPIGDVDSLLAAMDGVHTVFHLIGTENRGRHARLDEVDVLAARNMVAAARAARVGHIVYVSRAGADKASAFPVLRAKGEIESLIRSSGVSYTIFRSSVLFGDGDAFGDRIAMLLRAFPFYLVPGEAETAFQPLWVEDLVTCLAMSLEHLDLIDQAVEVGGPEILSYRRVVMRVMHAMGISRPLVSLPLLWTRSLAWFFDGLFARWPISMLWTDMLSTPQTAELGNIERLFGFRPAAFDVGLIDKYMQRRRYLLDFVKFVLTTRW
jgi:uncharacterized protein YbjT (DUF2867 family)